MKIPLQYCSALPKIAPALYYTRWWQQLEILVFFKMNKKNCNRQELVTHSLSIDAAAEPFAQ